MRQCRECANDVAAEFPGHAATFADGYPLIAADADGNPTLIVNTDNVVVRHGILEGEFEFLEKPFSADRLAAKIRQVLEAAQADSR